MQRGVSYFFSIFWDVKLWRKAESYKNPRSLGLFTPPPYKPIKGVFVISFMCIRYQNRALYVTKVWAWFMMWKIERRILSLGVCAKIWILDFWSKSLGGGNKLEKNYFLLHIYFTSLSPLEVHLQSLKRF